MRKKFKTPSAALSICWVAHVMFGPERLVGMGTSQFEAKEATWNHRRTVRRASRDHNVVEAALELPVSQALVSFQTIEAKHYDTAFTLSLLRGLLLGMIVCYYRLFVRENLREKASRMQELASRDALTGVGNRRWFDEEASALLFAERTYPCVLLLVDTDHFEEVNDTFGHPQAMTFCEP